MKLLVSIILVLFSAALPAQSTFYIKGKVFDDSTKLPMEGASVLCQNTTKGTITNKDGEFRMELPAGGHNLIVSYTGFESEAIRISSSADNSNEITVYLKKKEKKVEMGYLKQDSSGVRRWETRKCVMERCDQTFSIPRAGSSRGQNVRNREFAWLITGPAALPR